MSDGHGKLPFYSRYSPCVIGLETEGPDGSRSMGTAFHIGDGYLVTARHVLEGRNVVSLVATAPASISLESLDAIYDPDDRVDLALLRSDFSLSHYMNETRVMLGGTEVEKVDHIQIGGHLDDWIDDGLVLMDVVIFGFPAVPTAREPVLVAAKGEVNAVIDPYIGATHPLFVVSPIARGGFSGGPVLTADGWLLGVVTSSLNTNYEQAEQGFAAALTVEPLLHMLFDLQIFPGSNRQLMYHLRHGFGLTVSDFGATSEELARWDAEEASWRSSGRTG
jgi:S1-C subfamily serine protease